MSEEAKPLPAIPLIDVNPAYKEMLRGMWRDAHRWVCKANGDQKSLNNAIGTMLAKELAIKSLDGYFKAIDDLLPPDTPKEPA